jgi:adenylate cyclase
MSLAYAIASLVLPNPHPLHPMNPRRQAITVLLVDDQAIIGESIRQLLRDERYIDFHHCQDPHLAFSDVASVKPDVILQDLIMPGVDGLDLLMQLKRDTATRDIPVIVLSSREEPRTKAEAFRLGANDYLVKLPSEVELVARIRHHADAMRNARQRNLAMQALAESREQLRRSHEQVQQQAAELERRNLFIQKTFGRYLSDDVVAQLLDAPDGLKLGGELRVVTIMMADLRGFTSTANGLAPPVLIGMLNTFLGAMNEVIQAHRGMVDEFIGDAILAIFGAPHAHGDEADRAMRCALQMQHALAIVNERHRVEGLPQLNMGIALHTGEVVVGNIGSDVRAKYGVVGSNVNLTARIESATVGGQVLVSEATRSVSMQPLALGERLSLSAKGFEQELVAWELLGIGDLTARVPQANAEDLVSCTPPVQVLVRRIENKQLSDIPQQGLVVAVSANGAVLRLEDPLPVWSEVQLQWLDDQGRAAFEVVAKVRATGEQGLKLRFSVARPQVLEWLAKRNGGAVVPLRIEGQWL